MKEIIFTPVDSNLIVGVHHNPETKLLTMNLVYGIRTHDEVPVELFNEMMAAPSVGSFYSKSVKNQHPPKPVENVLG